MYNNKIWLEVRLDVIIYYTECVKHRKRLKGRAKFNKSQEKRHERFNTCHQ